MKILVSERQTELVVKKSRFIAVAKIITGIDQVKDLVNQARAEHPEARHVVHAAVVGDQFSFSDDREPKGTAGRPALEVLKGSGISNICVLIIRYFGGTLLGTGGLVKAYGDSVKMLLDGIDAREYVPTTTVSFSVSYNLHDSAERLLESCQATITNKSFDSEVSFTCTLPVANLEDLRTKLTTLTGGKVEIKAQQQ